MLRTAALAGVVVAAACTSPADRATAPSPTSDPSTTTDPVDIRIVADDPPVWRLPDPEKVKSVDEALLVGDHLILTPVVNFPMTVVDLAAGKIAWTLDGFSQDLAPGVLSRAIPRPFAIDDVVPVAFFADCPSGHRPEICQPKASSAAGVAGLDLPSGRTRWLRALDDLEPKDAVVSIFGLSGDDVEIVGGDRHTIVATARWDRAHATTVGLDATTGTVRWKRDGFYAAEALGPVAVGTSLASEGGDRIVGLSTWEAISLATGEEAWTADLDSDHRIQGRSSDLLVLQGDSTGQVVTVETAAGEVHRLGKPYSHIECPRNVVQGPLACSFSQRDTPTVIQDLTDPSAPRSSAVRIAEGGVTAQAGRTVFVSAMPYAALNGNGAGSYAATPDGIRVSEIWPGTVLAASPRWVVLGATDPKSGSTPVEVRALHPR